MRQNLFLIGRIAIALAFAWIAITVLANQFGDLSFDEVGASLSRIGGGSVVLMLLATGAAYAAISTYDAFALSYAGMRLPLRRSANMVGPSKRPKFWLLNGARRA